jgi:hypothetical protein
VTFGWQIILKGPLTDFLVHTDKVLWKQLGVIENVSLLFGFQVHRIQAELSAVFM